MRNGLLLIRPKFLGGKIRLAVVFPVHIVAGLAHQTNARIVGITSITPTGNCELPTHQAFSLLKVKALIALGTHGGAYFAQRSALLRLDGCIELGAAFVFVEIISHLALRARFHAFVINAPTNWVQNSRAKAVFVHVVLRLTFHTVPRVVLSKALAVGLVNIYALFLPILLQYSKLSRTLQADIGRLLLFAVHYLFVHTGAVLQEVVTGAFLALVRSFVIETVFDLFHCLQLHTLEVVEVISLCTLGASVEIGVFDAPRYATGVVNAVSISIQMKSFCAFDRLIFQRIIPHDIALLVASFLARIIG